MAIKIKNLYSEKAMAAEVRDLYCQNNDIDEIRLRLLNPGQYALGEPFTVEENEVVSVVKQQLLANFIKTTLLASKQTKSVTPIFGYPCVESYDVPTLSYKSPRPKNVILTPKKDNKNLYVINQETSKIVYVDDVEKVRRNISYDQYAENVDQDIIYGFNPFGKSRIYYNEKGEKVFNQFEPAPWRYENFAYNKPVEPVPLPEIYKRFFDHLLSEDAELIDYVFQWSAMSLRDKPLTYLYLFSELGGVGKGFLGEILCLVHGLENSTNTNSSRLGSQFNSLFASKSLVFIDEVNLIEGKTYDIIKSFNGATTILEKKGVDAVQIPNEASFMMTTNKLDSLKGVTFKTDRRFSIIPCRELKFTWPSAEKEALLAPENISLLGRFLYNYPINPKYKDLPYQKGEVFEKFSSFNNHDWQSALKDYVAAELKGKTVLLKHLTDYMCIVKGYTPRDVSGSKLRKFISEHAKGIKARTATPQGKVTHLLINNEFVAAPSNHDFKTNSTIDMVTFEGVN